MNRTLITRLEKKLEDHHWVDESAPNFHYERAAPARENCAMRREEEADQLLAEDPEAVRDLPEHR